MSNSAITADATVVLETWKDSNIAIILINTAKDDNGE